ncbi:MAG: LacI family DNA-binding transcriptional regulator [Saprospiraceae bacterium]|nr:LacI family DNA-binding transcriptional regulator [Saprospiraceae bacterium]
MQKITIKELAKLLDVNPSTISRALHDHPDISQVLKERIKKIAKDFNFVPNHAAVNLRNKKSKLIGLILPEISMLFVPSIIEGVSNYLNKRNYNLLVLSSYENYEKEIENIDVCIKSNVDGILISLTNQTKNVDHLDRLNEFEIPVVIFDKTVEQVQFNEVK